VTETADLITTSGRESMTVTERIELLRNGDMNWLLFSVGKLETLVAGTTGQKRYRLVQGPTGAAIHDYNQLVGWTRNTITLYDRAIERGTPVEQLQRGANKMLSDLECRIMAFRRGGHEEYKVIQKAQQHRDKK
jgi:hypothetical protein